MGKIFEFGVTLKHLSHLNNPPLNDSSYPYPSILCTCSNQSRPWLVAGQYSSLPGTALPLPVCLPYYSVLLTKRTLAAPRGYGSRPIWRHLALFQDPSIASHPSHTRSPPIPYPYYTLYCTSISPPLPRTGLLIYAPALRLTTTPLAAGLMRLRPRHNWSCACFHEGARDWRRGGRPGDNE